MAAPGLPARTKIAKTTPCKVEGTPAVEAGEFASAGEVLRDAKALPMREPSLAARGQLGLPEPCDDPPAFRHAGGYIRSRSYRRLRAGVIQRFFEVSFDHMGDGKTGVVISRLRIERRQSYRSSRPLAVSIGRRFTPAWY
jgi:hypothetical protein